MRNEECWSSLKRMQGMTDVISERNATWNTGISSTKVPK